MYKKPCSLYPSQTGYYTEKNSYRSCICVSVLSAPPAEKKLAMQDFFLGNAGKTRVPKKRGERKSIEKGDDKAIGNTQALYEKKTRIPTPLRL